MKIKILTTENTKQIILTPEDEFERDVCVMLEKFPILIEEILVNVKLAILEILERK